MRQAGLDAWRRINPVLALLGFFLLALSVPRSAGADEPAPIKNADSLARLEAGIALLEQKADSKGEDADLKKLLKAAAKALRDAQSAGRIKQAETGGPRTEWKDDKNGVLVIPEEYLAAGFDDFNNIQLLNTLAHEGTHLAQGIADALPFPANDTDLLDFKLKKMRREIDAYNAGGGLKLQIAETLSKMADAKEDQNKPFETPVWAGAWKDLKPSVLRELAKKAKNLGVAEQNAADYLQGLVDFAKRSRRPPQTDETSDKTVQERFDKDKYAKKLIHTDKRGRMWVVSNINEFQGAVHEVTVYANPTDVVVVPVIGTDKTVTPTPVGGIPTFTQDLDTGIAEPQGGLLLVDQGGSMAFVVAGRVNRGPRGGIVKVFRARPDGSGFDEGQVLIQDDPGLPFPTSIAQLSDGRVYVFDAETWTAYPLVDQNGDGVPDAFSTAGVLTVPQIYRNLHPLDLLSRGTGLLVQPRVVVTGDDELWGLLFRDSDGDGVFGELEVQGSPYETKGPKKEKKDKGEKREK